MSLPAPQPAELNGGQSCALMDQPVTTKCTINSFVSLCKDKFGNEHSEKEPACRFHCGSWSGPSSPEKSS